MFIKSNDWNHELDLYILTVGDLKEDISPKIGHFKNWYVNVSKIIKYVSHI